MNAKSGITFLSLAPSQSPTICFWLKKMQNASVNFLIMVDNLFALKLFWFLIFHFTHFIHSFWFHITVYGTLDETKVQKATQAKWVPTTKLGVDNYENTKLANQIEHQIRILGSISWSIISSHCVQRTVNGLSS